MVANRTATDDLTEGVGTIRWEDDEVRIREAHPDAYVRTMPGVGSPLVVGGLVDGLGPFLVKGYIFLGLEGVKYIVLSESAEAEGMDARQYVRALAQRFGFGPVTSSKQQVWVVRGVQVLLQFYESLDEEGVFSGFRLRLNRPGDFQSDFRIFEGKPLAPRREP